MRPSKELIGASSSLLVLAAVARQSSYGYDIVRQINQCAGGIFTWQEGTIYPLLHKLEQDGLLRARWQEAENGRRRKYYAITARGRAALSADVKQWSRFHAMILDLYGSGSHA
ncbi:MAG TPA: PadR family transcriptional regulator [Humisphaera sp.]|jgi:DNA-binding PadR family transcriptional regulator|nr:PadR family transcriptional regulator [Humisphaera sp.]